MCVKACSVIGKSVFHKGPISSSDAYWLWYAVPLPLLSLTHIQRSDIDSNRPPLSHSLTSWRPTGTLTTWSVAGGQAAKEAAVTLWTVVQGAEEPTSQSAIDLCGLGGPCLWGHLPQLTDYYRLCWDLGLEKNPSTITLYGRDISNKIPISSEREKVKRGKERIFGKLPAMGGNLISFCPFVFFFPPFLHSNSSLIQELHKWDLQNRLTPFISSVCHYTCIGFEAVLCFSTVYCKQASQWPQISLIRADERDKPSRAKSKQHPHCIQSSICTQSTQCRPNTAEGDENSVPGMT